MAAGGGGGGVRSEINVTPLVDVVLVLLIIFMVVTPLLQMGYDVNVPPKADENQNVVIQPPPDQLIIRMDREGKAYINKEQIALQDFPFRLSQATQGRGSKMIFFSADGELPYHQVSEFMDLCYNNGATNLGIVLDDIEEGDAGADAGAAPAPP
jgi:biopolymer transport protein ExbD